MNRSIKFLSAGAAILTIASLAAARPSNVTADAKFSWSENCGWLNWRDAGNPTGSQGMFAGTRFLSGYVWSENVGWINLGDGTPANGTNYVNANGADFGVNHDPATGLLSGLAWGENVGWINFSAGTLTNPTNPARLSLDQPRRLLGAAWGENIGWLSFDSLNHAVTVTCPCDWNQNGVLSVQDIFDFLVGYFSGNGDINQSGVTSVQDVFDFLACYFAGC